MIFFRKKIHISEFHSTHLEINKISDILDIKTLFTFQKFEQKQDSELITAALKLILSKVEVIFFMSFHDIYFFLSFGGMLQIEWHSLEFIFGDTKTNPLKQKQKNDEQHWYTLTRLIWKAGEVLICCIIFGYKFDLTWCHEYYNNSLSKYNLKQKKNNNWSARITEAYTLYCCCLLRCYIAYVDWKKTATAAVFVQVIKQSASISSTSKIQRERDINNQMSGANSMNNKYF